ncbi:inhibitor of Bruton tyrosine kinase-like isoform X2 [Montipora foliosa]|uniref:inhibitor of Bruton tyrosine kinase-like isoform X2 n=1 Tax=Montipora foliosa TaxID=591990 RepID=UPI0035F169DC
MNCSPKCRKSKHKDLNFSSVLSIGEENAAKVKGQLPRLCSNFALVKDQCGRTALHLAASCGKCDILEWLVTEHAADLNSKDEESGWTSLHRSVFYGHLDCAVRLIQCGADLSSLDKEGLSPLDLIQLDSPVQITSSVQAKVIQSCTSSSNDELTLRAGDIVKDITVIGNKCWNGLLNGKRGYFPRKCVKLLRKDYPLELYTWGSNTNFTLGHRDENTRHTPEILECPLGAANVFIKEVVMCKFHTVFLSDDGRVFTCGHGRGGRLGHGDEDTILEPKQVMGLDDLKCVAIAAAQDHTVVVTEDGSVYTFGLNDSYQLGHSPAPRECLFPKMVLVKSWRGKAIVGAAAGRYHSVFHTQNEVYSCGLNAGQLGHSKGEEHQILPRQISGLADRNVSISKLTCSDAATVCATTKGDIFLLNLYTCRRIISRFADLTHLEVFGGELDMTSPKNSGSFWWRTRHDITKEQWQKTQLTDELVVTALKSRGTVFQWKAGFGSAKECYWQHSRQVTVKDFAFGKQFLIVSDRGEAFTCLPEQTKPSSLKADAKKRTRTSSISQKTSESTLAHSPPLSSSPLRNFTKEKDHSHAPASSSVLSLLAEEESKKDVLRFRLERIPYIHRGLRVFTDNKSRGFAALQISPKEGLKNQPRVSPSMLWRHMTQLLEETSCEDDIHDVEFLVKERAIPAHAFVLSSRSHHCNQLICENKETWPCIADKRMRTIPLRENIDYDTIMNWLRRLYNGDEISDEEVFVEGVAVKGRNGYHCLRKDGNSKEMPPELNKTAVEIKNELDEDVMHPDRVLADLLHLAEANLDTFAAATFDEEEETLPNSSSEDDLDFVDINQGRIIETTTKAPRKGEEDTLSSWAKSMIFSRLNCPDLYDVVIVCEDGTELQCHKCILVAGLDYFRSMWASDWLEASGHCKTIKLPFSADTLEVMLDFLYTGQAGRIRNRADLELLGQVLIVADQLLIYRLKEICEAAISNLITLKNVTQILEFSLLYNANQLRDVCTEFITNNLGYFLEARTLNSLGHEALVETSKAYRSLVKGMPWRIITPSDVHDTFLNESPEPKPGKRRKNARRKKSSKSESEQDAPTSDQPVQDTQAEEGLNVGENGEVFLQQENDKSKSPTIDENAKRDQSTEENATQEHQSPDAQTGYPNGLWYHKNVPESDKPNETARDKTKPAVKLPDDTEEKHDQSPPPKEEVVSKKVFSPEKSAWSSQTSPSPPASSFKDIIEQEKSKAVFDANSVNKVSPSIESCHRTSSELRPQASGALRWTSGSRLSQKQRKRSKSNSVDQSDVEKPDNDAVATAKEHKPTSPAWGGVGKDPVPVNYLRDVMQEEEQRQSGKKPLGVELSPASPRVIASPEKQGSARKKLSWRSQPDFYATAPDFDDQDDVNTGCERFSGLPSSPPNSVWQSTSIASSPPSSPVAFSSILESQEQEISYLDRISKKPFHMTQLEEKAMEELLHHYGGKDNACEFVTVERIPSTAAHPIWKKERSPSLNSS